MHCYTTGPFVTSPLVHHQVEKVKEGQGSQRQNSHLQIGTVEKKFQIQKVQFFFSAHCNVALTVVYGKQ